MKSNSSIRTAIQTIILALLSAAYGYANSPVSESGILDDFSNNVQTSIGTNRMMIDDASIGGKSKFQTRFEDGVLEMSGDIKPARGQPGFVSMVLLLNPDGTPADLSEYEGIQLKIQVIKGSVSVLAASSEIFNYDYHGTPIARKGEGILTIRVPFDSLKRLWSEQTPLNLKTIVSVNLVASSLQPQAFKYEISEVSFY